MPLLDTFIFIVLVLWFMNLYIHICDSEQISESLKRCGISDTTTYVLVARFSASDDEVRSWSSE